MKNKLKWYKPIQILHVGSILLLAMLLLGMPAIAYAQQPTYQPHTFWGYVETDTGEAAPGVYVTAVVNGVPGLSFLTDGNGKYGSDFLTELPESLSANGENGDIITFQVDGQPATITALWLLVEVSEIWQWVPQTLVSQVTYVSDASSRADLSYTPVVIEDDNTPPDAVVLSVMNQTASTITLGWEAPGDDGVVGQAAQYDVRYRTDAAIDDTNWDTATQAGGETTPKSPGSMETFTISGLVTNTTYYFAVKTADEVPNWSDLSNSPGGSTDDTDDTAPSAVTLAVTGQTSVSITLGWTSPGDDNFVGTAVQYDIRYRTDATITDGNWDTATQVTGEPAPLVAGTVQSFTVTGLSNSTTYYFALKTVDEIPNWSALSNSPDGTTEAPDTTAPGTVSLSISGLTSNSVTLGWLAPGDDDMTGQASSYDIRYRTDATITDGNWDTATQVTGEPAPLVAGTVQSLTVTGLSSSTTYYFALKTADEIPNWSGLSNSPDGTTEAPDTTAPGTVSLSISGLTSSSVTLSWLAPGDDDMTGQASSYDIRYRTDATITDTNWNTAIQMTGEPVPGNPGIGQTFLVTGLAASTSYYFAMKTADEVPNWSAISNSPLATTPAASTGGGGGGGGGGAPAPTPTPTPDEEEEPAPTSEPEETPTPTPEATPEPTPEETTPASTAPVATTPTSTPASTPAPTPDGTPVPAGPAVFSTTNLSISPDTAAPDETITISVDVINSGESEGTYSVVLLINGIEQGSQEVIVAGGENRQVLFTSVQSEAGEYVVEIDGQTVSFSIVEPTQLFLVLAIVGGVVGLGIVIFFIRRIYLWKTGY